MKQVGQNGDMLVLQLSFEEWVVLSTLMRYREGEARSPGVLSHGGVGVSPQEAQACLEESLRQSWLADERLARSLLADSTRCVVEEDEAVLHLTRSEIDVLLRAVNGKRLSAWESLGRPSQGALHPPIEPAALQSYRLLQAADFLAEGLLSIVR